MAQVAVLTIDNTKVADNVTDFPVYVDLSDMNATFWSTVANGGGDIRVFKSDGTTELAREVVSCDTGTDTGEIHFKFTGTLSGSVDTVVQIHADGVSSDYAVGATYGRNNVWSGYDGVYHLNSNTDSHGSNDGTATAMTYSAGKIGDAGDFNGTSSYLTYPDATLTASNSFSVSFWVKADSNPSGNGCTLFEKFSGHTGWNYGTPSIGLNPTRSVEGSNRDSSGIISSSTFGDASDGSYHHICMIHDSSVGSYGNVKSFFDGVLITTVNNIRAFTDYNRGVRVGKSEDSWQGAYLDGLIDETRITSSALSADWITTEYNNQNSPATFYTISDADPSFTIAESLSLSETSTNLRGLVSTTNESLSLSETITALKGISFTIAESLGLVESYTYLHNKLFIIAESLNVVEVKAYVQKKWSNISKSTVATVTNGVKTAVSVITNRPKS